MESCCCTTIRPYQSARATSGKIRTAVATTIEIVSLTAVGAHYRDERI
jgi:hypothetical protein